MELFAPKKLSLSSKKYGFGIRDPEKTYSGSRGQKGSGSRIPDPDQQHWIHYRYVVRRQLNGKQEGKGVCTLRCTLYNEHC
jgi:hypothetical protein